ncbi:sensor histidine kinase [Rhizohabitans arisaemae]|uniref:sensor histidine kinase n=1 Tax=Rhizohabitans arisaemae TaxID=2720610 RepID=UPI0024B26BA4|nr:histidine kinase [Rhizohabitans arisaemae]
MKPTGRPAARLAALNRWSTVPADALLAAALFTATLGPGQVLSGPAWLPALQTALVAPLAWRRRAPMTVLVAIGVAAAVQWALDVQLPADAALLVALYTVAARRPWRHTLVAALALQVGVLLAAARWAPPGRFPLTAAALSAMAAAAVLAGLWMRTRRAYVISLERDREQRARLAVAEERARMTRDMHDIVTHNLSVMVALADSAAHVRHSAPDRAAAAVEQIAETGRQALQDMRRSLGAHDPSGPYGAATAAEEEHPSLASTPGLRTPAGGDGADPLRGREDVMIRPMPGIAELGPLAERMRAAGLPTRLRVAGDVESVPATAQLTIYRLAQEALTNTLRHAPGAGADVRVRVTARRAEVEVVDDGAHPRVSGVPEPESAGRGLAGMRERVSAYGGTLSAGPVGGGWRVAAVLDLGAPR